MERLIEIVIEDTIAGRLRWECGGHSDTWSARASTYTLSQVTKGIWNWYFVMYTNSGVSRLKIRPWQWRKIQAALPPKLLTPEQAAAAIGFNDAEVGLHE